jgi:hypothetical protein
MLIVGRDASSGMIAAPNPVVAQRAAMAGALARPTPQPARAIPTPPHTPALVYAGGAGPQPLARGHEAPSPVEIEAAGSILALLALVCVALSLTAVIWAPLALFVVVGLLLAHWVVGNPWHRALTEPPLGSTLARHVWLRWLLWPGMSVPRDFKLIALISLVVGYVWLIASVTQLLWTLVH